MLLRALLIFASATVGACNPAASAPLNIAALGRVVGSYANSFVDTLGSISDVTRPKKLSRETVTYVGDEPAGTIERRSGGSISLWLIKKPSGTLWVSVGPASSGRGAPKSMACMCTPRGHLRLR